MPRFIFDAEATWLHGVVFSAGWVVEGTDGEILERGYEAVRMDAGDVDPWVAENVLPRLPEATCETVEEVRSRFWAAWLRWKNEGATLWADCGWPVEARFLAACVDDDPEGRGWEGPYPLQEIATVLSLAEAKFGPDPTDYSMSGDLAHHPTHDCLVSLRQLQAAERRLGLHK